jgi:hypothetical protein
VWEYTFTEGLHSSKLRSILPVLSTSKRSRKTIAVHKMGSGVAEKEVQSVSSETGEEDSSDSRNPVPRETKSGKEMKLPSSSNTTTTTGVAGRNLVGNKIPGMNEGRLLEPGSPSPEVTKGGEHEFVMVSQIARIEVNEVAQKQPPVRVLQRMNTPPKVPKITSTPQHLSSESNAMESTSTVDERCRSNTRTRNAQDASSGITSLADDDVSESVPMDVIEKSPYEPGLNAEKGEAFFEEIKRLLKEENNEEDVRLVNPETIKIFGPTNGWCLVKAYALIDKSGMAFSQEWVRGNIRGNIVGKIPNYLLLLCLVPKRFVKASELLLSGLCRDMEVYSIVHDALHEWGVDDEYKSVSDCVARKEYKMVI